MERKPINNAYKMIALHYKLTWKKPGTTQETQQKCAKPEKIVFPTPWSGED
jgi:hypothetical protein